MDAATVYRVLDLIPDRTNRTQLGAAFADVRATTCLHPERLALLSEFLHWLSPIYPTTKDDQMRFGLFANAHRQAQVEDEELDEQDAEIQDLETEERVEERVA